MIDFHMHSFASDGCLCPAEIFRRAEVAGIDAVGIADHADFSNAVRLISENIQAAVRERALDEGIAAFAGIELTHVRPAHIGHLVKTARHAGAEFVIVHGETPVEPVVPGTNRAAVEAACDILAHPGLITLEDARRAAEKGVLLEISGKAGHSLANGHVADMAKKAGAKLIFGSDSHEPGHMHGREDAEKVLRAAGLDDADVSLAFANALELYNRLLEIHVRKDVENGEK
ncbi:MAG TPA: histidinol phosphate phosphatase domain-containing protein [Planctomycetes bacterium]|nr:histidinol phosphate phosphatase domain-containing protein [Planctomycetota bacterium]